jgi:DNA-binding MarR family transcriptional regulator
LLAARFVLDRALSSGTSLIALDILISVARVGCESNSWRDAGPTVKELLLGLSHSRRGVRLQLNRLIAAGFLELRQHHADRRRRIVTLADAGVAMFSDLGAAVAVALDPRVERSVGR